MARRRTARRAVATRARARRSSAARRRERHSRRRELHLDDAAAPPAATRAGTTRPARAAGRVVLLVGTRKGAWILKADAARRRFALDGPHFLGCIVHHVVLDPRDRRTLLAAARTGHLGPTLYRSTDLGRTWKEASRPPAFPRLTEGGGAATPAGGPTVAGAGPRSVDAVFWLTPGHPSNPGVWYAGTIPHGLFRSEDGGDTWEGVEGFNRNPSGVAWGPPSFSDTPEGGITHSILIDPRDPAHLFVALSIGGLYESTDEGDTWRPLNRGVAADFLPEKDPLYGHDPHCVALHPLRPSRLYQANHCGVYRLDRPGDLWTRIGRALPAGIGDIGFPIVLHPRDPDTAWIFPMDGTTVWPRTSPGGRPAVYRTRDAGVTWQRQDRGLPRRQAWLTVKRQAMTADAHDPVGVYFGTTSGGIWMSPDEGRTWRAITEHLPHIYAVVAAEV